MEGKRLAKGGSSKVFIGRADNDPGSQSNQGPPSISSSSYARKPGSVVGGLVGFGRHVHKNLGQRSISNDKSSASLDAGLGLSISGFSNSTGTSSYSSFGSGGSGTGASAVFVGTGRGGVLGVVTVSTSNNTASILAAGAAPGAPGPGRPGWNRPQTKHNRKFPSFRPSSQVNRAARNNSAATSGAVAMVGAGVAGIGGINITGGGKPFSGARITENQDSDDDDFEQYFDDALTTRTMGGGAPKAQRRVSRRATSNRRASDGSRSGNDNDQPDEIGVIEKDPSEHKASDPWDVIGSGVGVARNNRQHGDQEPRVLVNNFMRRLGESRETPVADGDIVTDGLDGVPMHGIGDFQEIADAIQDHPVLQGLYLSHCQMSHEALAMLSKALEQNTRLTRVDLHGNGFGNEDLQTLCEALASHQSITHLDFSEQAFTSAGTEIFATLLNESDQSGKIISLILDDNKIDSVGLLPLCESLKTNKWLQELSLNQNLIDDSGASMLGEMLQANNTLTKLDVRGNLINDTGAAHLGEMLKSNRTLTKLDVRGNTGMTVNALSDLANALRKNNTLMELVLDQPAHTSSTGDVHMAAIKNRLERNKTGSPKQQQETLFLTDIGDKNSGSASTSSVSRCESRPITPSGASVGREGGGGRFRDSLDKLHVREWTIGHVSAWLAEIDMKEYQTIFKKNKINGEMLLTLTSKDLPTGFGMQNTWHQKLMMASIEKLKTKKPTKRPGASPPSEGGSGSTPPGYSSFPTLDPGRLVQPPFDAEGSRPGSAYFKIVDEHAIKYLEFLDEGQFGATYLAEYKGRRVVVKTPHRDVIAPDILQELKAFVGVEKRHPRVLPLIGIAISDKNISFITEYMPGGSLKSALKSARKNWFYILPNFLSVAIDIAEGLQHLHKHRFVHRDVSARNILLDQDNRACLTDFGLTRIVKDCTPESGEQLPYYRSRNGGFLPIRWLPAKTLREGVFNESSDVYMLGVTLWEILSEGKRPFGNLNNKQVTEGLLNETVDLREEIKPLFDEKITIVMERPAPLVVPPTPTPIPTTPAAAASGTPASPSRVPRYGRRASNETMEMMPEKYEQQHFDTSIDSSADGYSQFGNSPMLSPTAVAGGSRPQTGSRNRQPTSPTNSNGSERFLKFISSVLLDPVLGDYEDDEEGEGKKSPKGSKPKSTALSSNSNDTSSEKLPIQKVETTGTNNNTSNGANPASFSTPVSSLYPNVVQVLLKALHPREESRINLESFIETMKSERAQLQGKGPI